MKIAIIDDDGYWREYTEKVVRQYYDNDELEIDLYESAAKYLSDRKCYDVSFVDIEMPDMDGFQTITQARQYNREGIFIILTTHNELSRKGYMVNAFRYIHKTGMEEEFYEALKAVDILQGRNQKIIVKVVNEGQQELTLKNIIYIETEKHNILIHTLHGIIRSHNTMSDMEKLLDGKWFFRCHNAYIVNLDEITDVKDTILHMSDGGDIDISQRKLWKFKDAYMKRRYECANA